MKIVITIIMELIRGIDLKLKNDHTPLERIAWWTGIIAVVVVVLFTVLTQIGAFITTLVHFDNGV